MSDGLDLAPPREAVSFPRLLSFSSSYAAVQVTFAVMFALTTPLFMSLGVSAAASVAIWTIGPVAGILQPYIGAAGDRSQSRWGRRRPFILAGGLAIVVGLIALYLAKNVLAPINIALGIGSGIVAMIVLNIALNMLMQPSRAIVFDLVPAIQQTAANNSISFMVGLGSLLANAMVYLGMKFTAFDPFFLGTGLVVLFVIPTLLFAREKQWHKPEESMAAKQSVVKGVITAIMKMPKPVLRATIPFFLSWCMYFPFSISGTAYVAKQVFHGSQQSSNPHDIALYNHGIGIGALGMAALSLVTVLFSYIATPLMEKLGERGVYFFSHVLSTGCLVGLLFAVNSWEVILLFGGIGASLSVFNSVPFAVCARVVAEEETGVYAGLLNIVIVVSQLIGTGANVLALQLFHNDLRASIILSAGISGLAACAAWIMRRSDQAPAAAAETERLINENPF